MGRKVDADEIARLQELADLGVGWNKQQIPELDAIARRASAEFGTDVALVSIVLTDAQYWPGRAGLETHWSAEARGTPVEWSYCELLVDDEEDRDLGVTDAQIATVDTDWPEAEERVKASPLTNIDGIQCYLGTPLISSKGIRLGSFCVIGVDKPRVWTEEEKATLRGYAAEVVEFLESQRDG